MLCAREIATEDAADGCGSCWCPGIFLSPVFWLLLTDHHRHCVHIGVEGAASFARFTLGVDHENLVLGSRTNINNKIVSTMKSNVVCAVNTIFL